jgi:hypothetical protein
MVALQACIVLTGKIPRPFAPTFTAMPSMTACLEPDDMVIASFYDPHYADTFFMVVDLIISSITSTLASVT